ncbi:hypothetical protein OEIGOIKO_07539 [Streptomyces chrestomyceticus JCM 4735]|uniref:Uncharacterized protein n=1 Tax=Streptomyces chrestomyceticus JCM 4735 TaxID=1306181 RepID=A0A7U9Q1H7_9ACTN|nr:hypothetical protein OEIGOIKO_07539 [Streptomyces chrestomyceticus JCM 4735]
MSAMEFQVWTDSKKHIWPIRDARAQMLKQVARRDA